MWRARPRSSRRTGGARSASDTVDAVVRTLVERAAAAGRVTVPAERAEQLPRTSHHRAREDRGAGGVHLAADLVRTTALTDDEEALLGDATTDRVAPATERP